MTETLSSVSPPEDVAVSPPEVAQDHDVGAAESAQPSAEELETALDEEMSEHLGYDKHEAFGRNGGNSCNGVRTRWRRQACGDANVRPRAGAEDQS